MRPVTKRVTAICLAAMLPAFAANAQDDGVSSLPVFKGPFPETRNMVFQSQIDPEDLGALPVTGVWAKGMMNDVGGWTSPTGEEYALATNSGGIAIVRVTDPTNPEYLGRVESQAPFDFRNIWGDPDTFGNYAYFTTEIDDSSIVIIDMSGADGLPAVDDPFTDLPLPTYYVAPGGYDGSHNVVINEATGFAYLAGVHLKEGAANNACGADDALAKDADYLPVLLESETDTDYRFAVAYVWRRFYTKSWEWIDEMNRSEWSVKANCCCRSIPPISRMRFRSA